ncbi:MAG: chemotaxis protein CheD [Halieaceae bacterium]|jgi:chemotaxis protein CheD|nr:chemotaxis protein CheD [Halieaceae bacterium]
MPSIAEKVSATSIYLKPGELFFGDSSHRISTVLGSCIAITLWHPHRLLGGMCHFVLAGKKPTDSGSKSNTALNGRYSVDALEFLEQQAELHGTVLQEYQAKIFGGSNMDASQARMGDDSVGSRNASAAVAHLEQRQIPLLASHVGETGARRIIFDIHQGDVWVSHLPLQRTSNNHRIKE